MQHEKGSKAMGQQRPLTTLTHAHRSAHPAHPRVTAKTAVPTKRGRGGGCGDTDLSSTHSASTMRRGGLKNENLVCSGLPDKAYSVTRRLSRSVYMTREEDQQAALAQLLAHKQQQRRDSDTTVRTVLDVANIELENTYRLAPNSSSVFKENEVKSTIDSVLERHLRGRDYNPEQASKWTTRISNEINERVKMMDIPRYRFVTQVVVGQKQENSMSFLSQSIWNSKTDTFVSSNYKTSDIFAVATVFGIHLE